MLTHSVLKAEDLLRTASPASRGTQYLLNIDVLTHLTAQHLTKHLD